MLMDVYQVLVVGHGKFYVMPKPDSQKLVATVHYLSNLGVTHVVSHLEKDEEDDLGLSTEATLLAELGIELISYPIKDMNLPDLHEYSVFIDKLFQRLQESAILAIHCRAGIGRTGMTASCLLIKSGYESQNAIDQVSAARGTTIPDTQEQIQFIHNFSTPT